MAIFFTKLNVKKEQSIMKKLILGSTFLGLSLCGGVALAANFQVFVTNTNGVKAKFESSIGKCSNGNSNMWKTDITNGTANGYLPCPIQSSSNNLATYVFSYKQLERDGRLTLVTCHIQQKDAVQFVLNNAYTKVNITITPGGKTCNMTGTYSR